MFYSVKLGLVKGAVLASLLVDWGVTPATSKVLLPTKSPKNQRIVMPNSVQEPPYQYADGAGNLYLLQPDSLAYRPVTPLESSTGTYSGGEPKTVPVPPAARERLVALLERALATAQPPATPGRAKGTGWVAKGTGADAQEAVLAMNSPLKTEIEAYLRELFR
jgi:hypothetical protein